MNIRNTTVRFTKLEENIMAKIILFPKPKIKLTEEETMEYEQIKLEIENIRGLRDLCHCKRRVKAFLKKVEERE